MDAVLKAIKLRQWCWRCLERTAGCDVVLSKLVVRAERAVSALTPEEYVQYDTWFRGTEEGRGFLADLRAGRLFKSDRKGTTTTHDCKGVSK